MPGLTIFKRRLLITALSSVFIQHAVIANAACVDDGFGNILCDGNTDNPDSFTGTVTLENATGDVLLNNLPTATITNNSAIVTEGSVNTITTNGGNAVNLNNQGAFSVDRSAIPLDPGAWTNDVNGLLYNNGTLAGIAAALRTQANVPNFIFSNLVDTPPDTASPPAYFGVANALGDFSAVIYGNAPSVTINNYGEIRNSGYSFTIGDTLTEGHWSVANYGAGLTVINNNTTHVSGGFFGTGEDVKYATMSGDIVLLDRDPLKEAAKQINNGLAIAHDASEVGIRNSIINNQSVINGNIYLGAGEHIINNTANAEIHGNIYVDQKDAEVVSVSSGVETVVSSITGARRFTFNSSGFFDGNGQMNEIRINDVAGSVNAINLNLGVGVPAITDGQLELATNIFTNNLGINTVNLNCFAKNRNDGAACRTQAFGNMSINATDISIGGTDWTIYGAFAGGSNVFNATNNITLQANRIVFDGTFNAQNVIVQAGTNLIGAFNPPNTPINLATPDSIGTINGNLINRGNINVQDATLNVNGNASFEPGSTLSFRINPNGNGMVDVTGGTGSFSGNSTIIPSIKEKFVRTGDTFTVATNSGGAPVIQNSGLVQFTSSDASGNLVFTATNEIPVALNPTLAGNNAVMAIVNSPSSNPQMAQLQLKLQALDNTELQRTTERLRPEINDGAIRMVLGNTDRVLGIVGSHLMGPYAGKTSDTTARITDEGKLATGKGAWVQGFGHQGSQDKRNNVDGFTSSSTGFAFGADQFFGDSEKLRIGGAFSYAKGNIDNTGLTDNSRIDTNSYLAAIYASWSETDWFLNGAAGIGRHTYKTRRAALDYVAEGDHDVMQFTAKADAGWPIQINDDLTFIPIASFNYTHLDESGYKESGYTTVGKQKFIPSPFNPNVQIPAGFEINRVPGVPIALAIDDRSVDSIRGGLGGKALWSIQEDDWAADIALHALWNHEFGNIAQDTTARFIAGGNQFKSPGVKPDRDSLIIGSSVFLTGDDENDQVSLLANYDAELREKYFGQAFSMMLRYDFDKAPGYLKQAQANKSLIAAKQKMIQHVAVTEQDIHNIQSAIQPANSASYSQETIKAETEQAVTKAVDSWLAALSNKNINAYLNSYAKDFTPSDGSTRQVWERKRTHEMMQQPNGEIKVSHLTFKPNGELIAAIFTQTLTNGLHQLTSIKTLDLAEINGNWKILGEDEMLLSD